MSYRTFREEIEDMPHAGHINDEHVWRTDAAEIAARADARVAELEAKLSAACDIICDLGGEFREPDMDEARRRAQDAARYRWLVSDPIRWEEGYGVSGYILRIDGAKLRGVTIHEAIDRAITECQK